MTTAPAGEPTGEPTGEAAGARAAVHALAEAERAARAAYADPPPDADPLDWALAAFTGALAAAHLLPHALAAQLAPTRAQVAQAAELLAERSGHRRYAGARGRARLLESVANVQHAYTAATARPDPRESVRAALADARDVLIRHVESGSALTEGAP